MFNNYEKREKEVAGLSGIKKKIELDDDTGEKYNKIIILSAAFLVLFIFIVISSIFYFKNKPNIAKPQNNNENNIVFLPEDVNGNNNNNNQNDDGNTDLQAEKISLGQFYNKPKDDLGFEVALSKLDLPINVKSDIVNYYDISRKVDLDEVINDINNNGFAIIENPFSGQADNFYSSYKLLSEKNIPLLVTDDYLLYYYQNNLKELYKRIEKDVFYYSIYDSTKKLYEIANVRYKDAVEVSGISNDPAVEGQRMYLAYLAVILELLEPTEGQINDKVNLSEFYFTSQEAKKFDFELPSYLYDDVLRELELIRNAKERDKSPIFKYEKDYKTFKVPESYKKKARLYNFYLATEWIRSVFPLYYRSDNCPDCLLDQDDWLIGLAASSFMCKDLSDNQDIKNEWAKIYKIISFFSGLRQELTYLNYQEALVNLFGDDYEPKVLFARDNPDMINNALKLKAELEKFEFKNAEGGYDKENQEELRKVGLRLLQENYMPENYIYKDLTYPVIGKYLADRKYLDKNFNITFCEYKFVPYRCTGIGLDIINLINPIVDNSFFTENTNYEDYDFQSSRLRSDISKLNKDDWHRNTFWLTLNMDNNLFADKNKNIFLFFDNSKWQERLVNTSLASVFNLNLDEDNYKLANQEIAALNNYKDKNKYSYIEPNIYLINEIIASTDMLYNYLYNLNIMDESAQIKSDLIRLQGNFDKLKILIEKELRGENFNDDEVQSIYNFLFEYELSEEGEKSDKISLGDSKGFQIKSIEGLKMLVYTREIDGMKAFVFGPIFKYQEN